MAAGEPAGFGYWIGVLVDSGGLNLREEVPRDKRSVFRRLARFLVRNEFDHVKQLCGGARLISISVVVCVNSGIRLVAGTDPCRWPGSDEFLQSELDLLRPLVRGGRSRSPVKQKQTRWALSGVCEFVVCALLVGLLRFLMFRTSCKLLRLLASQQRRLWGEDHRQRSRYGKVNAEALGRRELGWRRPGWKRSLAAAEGVFLRLGVLA